MDVLEKMKTLIRCKKIKKNKVDLIVLRINKSGELCESAPCYHCTRELANNNIIKINKLYYSRNDKSIISIKFDDWLIYGPSHISKGWKWVQRTNSKK